MKNKAKFNPLHVRFRATFAGNQLGANRLGKIDEENEVLHDVQITLEGEALGHGIWLDREFCEAVAEQGNATGDVGLKVRYGHPAMCSDAIGTELGRAKNFRVVDIERDIDGEKVQAAGVIADIHLLKSAHSAPQGDIAKHVMETAKEDPKQFGQSIVFTYSDWVVKDADGNRHSYKAECCEAEEKDRKSYDQWFAQSADGKEYAVLGKLHGSDFTDTPAATDGIFSTNTLAEEAETMLAEHPQIMELLEKHPKSVAEFLERTGLDKKLESARVSGLQAAKDKEIAELKTQLSDAQKKGVALLADAEKKHADEIGALNAKLEATTAEHAKQLEAAAQGRATLEADIGEKSTALDAAKAEVEQLKAKVAETEKALSETKAALEVETERYRAQVGASLQQPGTTQKELHGMALIRSRVAGSN